MTKSDQLRRLLAEDRPLLFAGVYDALSARVAERAGMDGIWISGYSIAAAMFGMPDMGVTTLSEMSNLARLITGAVEIPVVVDGESGFGNAINVVRAVEEFQQAGAVGMQMGDDASETCPYLDMPMKIVEEEEAVLKVRAACEARRGDFVVFATSQNKLARSHKYVQAGAQGALFPWERITGSNPDPEWRRAFDDLRDQGAILVAVSTPFLPPVDVEALYRLGYRIVVFAAEALYASARVQADLWGEVLRTGTTAGFADRMYTRQQDFLPLVQEERMRGLSERFLTAGYEQSEDRLAFVNR